MTFRKYQAFLNTTKWKGIRAKIIKLRGNKCGACGSNNKIHVHHASYIKTGWSTQMDDLIVLCEWCHYTLHYEFRTSKMFDKNPQDLKQFTNKFIAEQKQKLPKESYVSDLSDGSLTTTNRTYDDYGLRSLIVSMPHTSFEGQNEYQDFKVNFLACVP